MLLCPPPFTAVLLARWPPIGPGAGLRCGLGAGYGLVATVTYRGGGGVSEAEKNFVCLKSTSTSGPLL